MKKLLVIVDVQEDFCEGGALGVFGGAEVARRIPAFLAEHAGDYAMIAVSQDHHRPDSDNGGHFAAEPDFVDTWPVHCVAGTPGAALRPEVAEAVAVVEALPGGPRVVHVRKGYGVPAYSALEGFVGDPAAEDPGEHFMDLVADGSFDRADVVGLALDHCVAATARDIVHLGPVVSILGEFTAAVDPSTVPALAQSLRTRGIRIIEGPDGSAPRADEEE